MNLQNTNGQPQDAVEAKPAAEASQSAINPLADQYREARVRFLLLTGQRTRETLPVDDIEFLEALEASRGRPKPRSWREDGDAEEEVGGVAHKKFKKTHRTPRILVVATESIKWPDDDDEIIYFTTLDSLNTAMNCYCTKYPVKDSEHMHVLLPARYGQSMISSIIEVCREAAEIGKPYDLIIADPRAYMEMIGYGKDFNPKPGHIIFTDSILAAKTLRGIGLAALSAAEMMDIEIVDEVFDRALKEKGIEKLKLKPSERSALDQYFASEHGYTEVMPSKAVFMPSFLAISSLMNMAK